MTDSKERIKAEAFRAVLTSSRDWHVYALADESSGSQFWIDVEQGVDHPTENRLLTEEEMFHVPMFLNQQFQLLAKPIDLRGDIPEQVQANLLLWVKRLLEIKLALDDIPNEPYEHRPQAYVTRDEVTGELVGVRMLLSESAMLGTSYEEIASSYAVTTPDKIENWPELLEQYRGAIAGGDAGPKH
jgi:hypothetical protein